MFTPLYVDPFRVLDALRRGYDSPTAALCALVDNSINAGARTITLQVVRDLPASVNRRNNVREYRIIDDGAGMDEARLQAALALGASDAHCTPGMLSKFGLGLKSASFSQGETLEVISSPGNGAPFLKYRVSFERIRAEGRYGTERYDLTDADAVLIKKHLPDGHGTIIRIADVHKNNHPSIGSTVAELQERLGVIYYYFMQDGVSITVDGTACEPFDPLFTDEANASGDLNENTWNGEEVRWLSHQQTVVLDGERAIKATVEATQLPHPPTFKFRGKSEWDQAKKHYRIENENVGFYVYRNRRLLSWAERFSKGNKAVIGVTVDALLSFRGRIHITDAADDIINIDVKKSHVMLSVESQKAVTDIAVNLLRKSSRAWELRGREVKRRDTEGEQEAANRIAEEAETPEDLPGLPDSDEAIAEEKKRVAEIVTEQTPRFERLVASAVQAATATGTPAPDLNTVVRGAKSNENDRILKADRFDSHVLYEPFLDAKNRKCVRINAMHGFAQVIYLDNGQNIAMRILFDLLLLKLAEAENFAALRLHKHKRKDVEEILSEHRRFTSEFLAQLCRDVKDDLPRDE